MSSFTLSSKCISLSIRRSLLTARCIILSLIGPGPFDYSCELVNACHYLNQSIEIKWYLKWGPSGITLVAFISSVTYLYSSCFGMSIVSVLWYGND